MNTRSGALVVLGATLMLACTLARPAQAALVVYNNGGPDRDNGNEMTEWQQFEDFSFGATTTFDTVHFWEFDLPSSPSFNGTFAWSIYDDSGALPGTLLYSGEVAPTSRTETGFEVFGYTEFENVFSTGAITLNAGNYWLGLHNGPLSSTSYNDMYWSTTTPNLTKPGVEDDLILEDVNYNSNDREHAFELINSAAVATPEPETWAMMGIGMLAVGAVGWRRKKSAQPTPELAL